MKHWDFWLFLPSCLLSIIGLAVTLSIAYENFYAQLAFFCLGIVTFIVLSRIDTIFFRSFSLFVYALGVGLLVLTLTLGATIRGSTRWLAIGNLSLQTSEFMKPILILGVSSLATRLQVRNFGSLLLAMSFIILPCTLIFLQPDLGTTIIVFAMGFYGVLALDPQKKHLIVFSFLAIVALPIAWNLLEDYQKTRVTTFLNPQADPLGSSYNQIQAVIAAGSGQLLGKGLGKGTQSHLFFLPEKHTDFIFSSLAEELGFVGTSLVISFFVLLGGRLIWLAQQSVQREQRAILLGAFFLLFFQANIHIGINLGILPVTGVTLPFLSVGGSSMVASWATLGLAHAVSRQLATQKVIFLKY